MTTSTSVEVYNVILDALILDTLILFCLRWADLKCDVPASGNLMRIANIPGSELAQLHMLAISGGKFAHSAVTGGGQWCASCWEDSAIIHAPRLRAIACNNITEDFSSLPLHWRQFTSITIYAVYRAHARIWNASISAGIRHPFRSYGTLPVSRPPRRAHASKAEGQYELVHCRAASPARSKSAPG
ncbi:hypothetical protein HYPSUDRAFT_660116 [Hypholoma sublateritium FD-334 SS-4]|uniref:Uncharacterized protein n=1 Tax=Hypholoma sublateritium (strain FD-334 SS-4) TaxID=945553 RepID=A0A0D2MFS5_HYPSF|nr:hypothetical protein HYPSUDRAFT_660116 [Hypholoma sublateritium FD-334 SS-4]